MTRRFRMVTLAACVIAAWVAGASTAQAQAIGSIFGKVSDASGGVLPGVQLNGYNVGGSQSGQQLTPSVRGSSSNVQWNLEGGSITDLSSNSSSIYYNFDSFSEIQVTTGGGDVSVQSSGLSINLVTK